MLLIKNMKNLIKFRQKSDQRLTTQMSQIYHLESNIQACEKKIQSYQEKIEQINNDNHGRRELLANPNSRKNNISEKNNYIIQENVQKSLFEAEQQMQNYHREILLLNNQITQFQEEIQGYRNYEEQRKNATKISTIRIGVSIFELKKSLTIKSSSNQMVHK